METRLTAADTNPEFPLAKRVLGIEGGGTKTDWVLTEGKHDAEPRVVQSGTLPASNLKLSTDEHLHALFAVMPEADRVGVFLAGCAVETDRTRLLRLAAARWPAATLAIGSDRDSALATAFGKEDGIVIIAGTGAAVHGRSGSRVEKAGGWGQLLGDRGSGYHLAMQALRLLLSRYDLRGEVSGTAQAFLRRLALNRLQDLVDWVSAADKMSVARLAPAVFEAAEQGDEDMLQILQAGADILAESTAAVARRLGRPEIPVKLFGGIFAHHLEYGALFTHRLRELLPEAPVELCTASGALGAAWLATAHESAAASAIPELELDTVELAAASTEQRNPRSQHLDRLPTAELVQLFIDEEAHVGQALQAARESLGEAVDLVAETLIKGGRLFYAGAGTSGRLGVLDASEIPPTFGAPPELVQGIIAGGSRALFRAVEGAEDQPTGGALAVLERGVTAADVVCGIAASGRTPFVLGALQRARELGARTILLSCNPARQRATPAWDVEIDLPTGPELVTGSTRLKAGTATKLVLNLLSTCAMIRLGKVHGNLMVNVQCTNAKLRDRGIRIVRECLGLSEAEARGRLERHAWNVRATLAE